MSERVGKRLRKHGKSSGVVDSNRGVMEVIDLSVPLTSLNSPIYPGSPLPVKGTFMTIEESEFQSNIWTFEEHTGTHVDAPAHVLSAGPSIDKVPLSRYVGRGIVLDFSNRAPRDDISRGDIVKSLEEEGFGDVPRLDMVLLFHTGYTRKFGTPAWMDNPVLSREACGFIANLGVKAIGFDAASPDRAPYPAHKLLLSRGVAIYENLVNLERLLHKRFTFIGAPLPLVGGTASPVRALAVLERNKRSRAQST